MSEDAYTKVTSESWLSRIGGAFKGIIIGVIMFLVSFVVLWTNEGRAVKTRKALEEGQGKVVSVSCEKVDPANDGKLVHTSGAATIDEVLRDPEFGVEAKAVKLKRVVEMFQWVEHKETKSKKKLGGKKETTTKYSYTTEWSDKPVDSSGFDTTKGHENPGEFPCQPLELSAEKVALGAFELSPGLLKQMNDFTPITIDKIDREAPLPKKLKGKAKVCKGAIYIGKKPSSPKVGDVRVKFMVVEPGEVSVIAQQTGQTFQPAPTKVGKSLEMLSMGKHSAREMFQNALASNKTLTWILRLVGFMLMGFGLSLVFRPLSVIADVVPIVGSIVGAGTGVVAFLIAGVLSLITIAVAWIAFRPVFAAVIFAVAAAVAVLVVVKMKKGKAARAAA